MRAILIGAAAAVAWAGSVCAADKPVFGPPADWVHPISAPTVSHSKESAAGRFLLIDAQAHLGPQGQELYSNTVVQFLTAESLAGGNLNFPWNPETQTLVIHRVNLLRDGKVIDLLGDGSGLSILRRETNLERASLDGWLTASMQLQGLQVGDILDLAFTMKSFDPTFHGHLDIEGQMFAGLTVERVHVVQSWPSSSPFRLRQSAGGPAFKITARPDGWTDAVLDATDVMAPKAPTGAPPRYADRSKYGLSDYKSWQEASALMAPYYDKAATLSAASPLKAEAARIVGASSDPKTRAAAVLHLVQDKVRYLFLGMNLGGYVPADADLTWTRRFGDCKGKTALLLALLHEVGVEAVPIMVSTGHGDGLDQTLPGFTRFDHVLVQARIGGKTYYLDGTRTGDGDLDGLSTPGYYFGLPLTDQGSDLQPLIIPPLERPSDEVHITLDATAGLDAPAPFRLEEILRGDDAIDAHRQQLNTSREENEKKLKKDWGAQFKWVEIKHVDYAFDEKTGEERVTVDGAGSMDWPWNNDSAARQYETDWTGLGRKDAFKRDTGPDMDAPFLINHPSYFTVEEKITLPQGGKGFSLVGGDAVSTDLGGFERRRTARLDKDVVTVDASTRSLVRELPGDHIAEVRAALAALVDKIVYARAPGDYEISAGEKALRLQRTPETASEYRDHADALFDKGDYLGAVKDLEAEVKLTPDEATGYNFLCYMRAEANKDLDVALTECEQALKLAPDDASIFDSRGLVHYRMGKFDLALKDYDQALKLSPDMASSLFMRGIVKIRLGDRRGANLDIAAAKKQSTGVASDYRKYGIAP